MLDKRHQIKLSISGFLCTFAFIYFIMNYNIPTTYARDTFFYADFFIANEIISDSTIPLVNEIDFTNRWGKIGNRAKLPILPLLLAIAHLITNLSISSIYVLFPSFVLISVGFYIIIKKYDISLLTTTIIAICGGITAPATVFYTITISAVVQGMTVLSIALLGVQITHFNKSETNTISRLLFTVIFILLLLFLFYWYPPDYLIFSGIIFVSGLLLIFKQKGVYLYPVLIVASVLIGLQVIELPLPSYLRNFQLAVLQISTLDFANPANANVVSYPTAYSPKYYALIPLAGLIPISLIGGIASFVDYRKDADSATIIALSWGIVIVLISGIYLANSTAWLIGRTYFLAFPVIILGAARGLEYINKKRQIFVSLLLLGLVLVSVVLQAGLPPVQIQSYEPGVKTGSQWAGTYATQNVVTDHKTGAPMAARGDFIAEYPRNYTYARQVYYTEDYKKFDKNFQGLLVLSKGMTRYGIFVMESAHKPISKTAYQQRVEYSSRIYSNGEVSVIHN